jgi:release factor glutamine methyltransferase
VRAFQAPCGVGVEREPLAYIVGRRAAVADLAVDGARSCHARRRAAASALGCSRRERAGRGTGSGAVALALAHERPDLELSGSDLSERALELARLNSRRLGLDVLWLRSDLLAQIADEFDAVVANLPYIAEGESANLAPEILEHEPPEALFAGPDGLSAIRALMSQLRRRRRVRFVALEVGAGQAGAVAELLRACGFRRLRRERDLAGIERVLVAEGRL